MCILGLAVFLIIAQIKSDRINKSLELGQKYLAEGKYEEAVLAYDGVIEIDSRQVAAYEGRAAVYIATENYDKAEQNLLQAKEIGAGAKTNELLIEVYDNTGKNDQSTSLLEETAILLEVEIKKAGEREKLVTLYDQLLSLYQRMGKEADFIIAVCDQAEKATGEDKFKTMKQNLTMGNSSENILNRGYSVSSNNVVYYTTGDCIYKKDGDLSTVVLKDTDKATLSDLNLWDGWIYYKRTSVSSTSDEFCKVRIDGKEKKTIFSRPYCLDFLIVGDRVFFVQLKTGSKYGTVNSVNLDGSDEKVVIENCCLYSINNGWIYYRPGEYMSPKGYYRIQLDGTQQECLIENISDGVTLRASGDFVYMLKNDILYRATIEKMDFSPLNTEKVSYFNIYNGMIYYNHFDSLAINRMKLDGSEVSTIISQTNEQLAAYGTIRDVNLTQTNNRTAYTLINIAGDKIFFLVVGFKEGSACCIADIDGKNLMKVDFFTRYVGE